MHPYTYSVYGHRLGSSIALSSIPPTLPGRGDIVFSWEPSRVSSATQVAWLQQWCQPNGAEWLCSARDNNGYLLRLLGRVDFWLSRDGCQIRGTPLRPLAPPLRDHLLLNHILPFAFTLRGLPVFHASGSCIRRKAVLFLADAGTGKSTLAAILMARGFPLLADECSVLTSSKGAPRVLPGPPILRLWPKMKKAILGSFGHSSLVGGKDTLQLEGKQDSRAGAPVLSRIYVLSADLPRSAPPTIQPLRGPWAVVELLRHSYQLDFSDHLLLARQFQDVSELVESVGIRRLRFSCGIEGLTRAAELVLSEQGAQPRVRLPSAVACNNRAKRPSFDVSRAIAS